MLWLYLNGKKLSVNELSELSITDSLNEFEKTTILFCQSWLKGQKEFKINTSGSTGAPKEIILKREAMEASAWSTIEKLGVKNGGTSLVCLDTKYIAGKMMLVRSLINGMSIISVEPSANPLDKINQPIDFTALVPYQLETILDQSPDKLNLIGSAIIGGASVNSLLKEKTRSSRCRLFATYGMTETISHVALQKLNGEDAQNYFESLNNINLRLDDRGCLCIKTPYLEKEIITNDLVELIDNKKFKWLGRFDNVINSGGVKIIPEKTEAALETVLNSLQISNRFFVAGLPDEKFGQKLVLVFEGFLNPLTEEEILTRAKIILNKYELPKHIFFVNNFIETNTGKINRNETLKALAL